MVTPLPSTRKWSPPSLLLKQKHIWKHRFCLQAASGFWVPLGCLLGASWVPPGCLLDAYWVFTAQEDMSSCSTARQCCPARRHVNKKTCFLPNKKTCLPAEQEDMSSCSTRRHVFMLDKKTYLLVEQNDISYLLVHIDTEWVVLKINWLGSHAGVIHTIRTIYPLILMHHWCLELGAL